MKTEIFCILFAVLCLAQFSVALRCYTCQSCSQAFRRKTCAYGEICSKMTIAGQVYGRSIEDSYKACVPASTTCEQQKQEPGIKEAIDTYGAAFRTRGGSMDVSCEYCSDRDLCNI